MRQDEEFAPLRIVRKNVTDFDRCAYRVYKSSAEYITVEAATALEAYRESGIKDPLRIVRETRFMERLLDQARFSEIEDIIETGVIMQAPQAITGHREAVPQAAPKSQAEAQAQFQPGIPSQAEEQPQDDIIPEEAEVVASSVEPDAPQEEPAPEVQAAPATSAPADETDDSGELSEEQIHALLGSEEQARAQAATAGDEGLSPDDVARLLDQGGKK
jgi:hypothetical protein